MMLSSFSGNMKDQQVSSTEVFEIIKSPNELHRELKFAEEA